MSADSVDMGQVAHGIELPGIYDGVSVWVMKDGARINRWAGVTGHERRAARVDAWLAGETQ